MRTSVRGMLRGADADDAEVLTAVRGKLRDGADADDAESVTAFERRVSRQRRRRKWLIRLQQVVLLAIILLSWEYLTGDKAGGDFGLIDTYYTSRPTAMLDALTQWASDGSLLRNVFSTLYVTVFGSAIGIVGGMVVGFALGVSPSASAVLTPFISAVYSIPRLALVPLFILWFGLGIAPKLALVAVLVFLLVFFNTFTGVRDVDEELIDVVTLMGANKLQVAYKVVLPSAMVWIVAGLRVAVPYGLVGAVTAEMLTSDEGMGFLLQRSAGQFFTDGVFAAISVMMVMAMVLNAAVSQLERSALRWKPKDSERRERGTGAVGA